MAESSPIFCHRDNEDTFHITQVFDLTYFSRSQRSNFDNLYDVLQLLNYWADLGYTKCVTHHIELVIKSQNKLLRNFTK
jgi:hypothetical protein